MSVRLRGRTEMLNVMICWPHELLGPFAHLFNHKSQDGNSKVSYWLLSLHLRTEEPNWSHAFSESSIFLRLRIVFE